jgi:DNA recombination protein RmuC
MHIEAQAQEILRNLSRLAGDFTRFYRDFEVLGGHLGDARSKYEEADKKLIKFGDKLQNLSIAGSTPSLLEEGDTGEKIPTE